MPARLLIISACRIFLGLALLCPLPLAAADDAPAKAVNVKDHLVQLRDGQKEPVLLTAEFADLDEPGSSEEDTLRWNLRIVTMDDQVVDSRSGQAILKSGRAIVTTPFSGLDCGGNRLAQGRYAYRYEADGYNGSGGFLDILSPGQQPSRIEDRALPSAVPLNASVPWSFYYGLEHAHSNYSDGGIPVAECTGASSGPHYGASPADAFSYAHSSGQLDWIVLLDHNHQFDDCCGTCTNDQILGRFHDGLAAAANSTVPGNFVGIYGLEWGVTTNGGHYGLLDVQKLMGWEAYDEVATAQYDYIALYTTCQNPAYQGQYGTTGTFCHPGSGDFNSFAQNADGRDLTRGIAVISGPYLETGTSFPDNGTRYAGPLASSDWYKYVLKRDWRVGPECHPDNHCWNYGSSTRNRTVVLAKSLTKQALMEAKQARHQYAASDMNVQMFFGTADYKRVMGDIFSTHDSTLNLLLWVNDPDGATVSTLILYQGNPAAGSASPTPLSMTSAGGGYFTASVPVPATGELYYYIYATLTSGAEIWSAPMWVASCGDYAAPSPVEDTLMMGKNAIDATITWTPSRSTDVAEYILYGSQDANLPFPGSWAFAGTSTSSQMTEPLTSIYKFYKVNAVDACGNESGGAPACATASATITSISPSATVNLGVQQTFNGSGTGHGVLSYAWDMSYDGVAFNVEYTGPSVTHTYAAAGTYTVALRITDSCTSPSPQVAYAISTVTVTQPACGPKVVISQVYGGGGNSGSYYKNDFIELFNRGDQPQSLTGWSVQYASSTGTTWSATPLSGSIPAGGYYLVQEAAGTGGTASLPLPDATGAISMAASSGKVLVASTTAAFSISCPAGDTVIDLVGYGTANCYEGASAAPALANTTSARRAGAGCTDSNNNGSDFSAVASDSSNPARNSSTALNPCTCQ